MSAENKKIFFDCCSEYFVLQIENLNQNHYSNFFFQKQFNGFSNIKKII